MSFESNSQALQISPFHEVMDSEIGLPGKGGAEIRSLAPDQRAGNGGG